MASIRCSQCSLVNFTTTTTCKRCGLTLNAEASAQWESPSNTQSENFIPQNDEWSALQPQAQGYYALPPLASDSRSKKTIGIVVVAILCIVAVISIPLWLKSKKTADAVSYDWQEFSPDDMSFSITMPGEPKNTTISRGPMQMNMTGVQMGKHAAFAVMYADLPPEAMNLPVDRLFEVALQSIKQRQEVIVLNRKDISLNGHKGMELALQPPASAGPIGTGVCRIYWVPPRLYITMAGGPDSAESMAARIRFLDSFRLLKD